MSPDPSSALGHAGPVPRFRFSGLPTECLSPWDMLPLDPSSAEPEFMTWLTLKDPKPIFPGQMISSHLGRGSWKSSGAPQGISPPSSERGCGAHLAGCPDQHPTQGSGRSPARPLVVKRMAQLKDKAWALRTTAVQVESQPCYSPLCDLGRLT